MRPLRTLTALGTAALIGCAHGDETGDDDTDPIDVVDTDAIDTDTDTVDTDTDPVDSDTGPFRPPFTTSDTDGCGPSPWGDGGLVDDTDTDATDSDVDTGRSWSSWCACEYDRCLAEGARGCGWICNG